VADVWLTCVSANQDVTEGPALSELLLGADEATDMLKHHLVQGKRKEEGEYELNVDPARHVTMDPNKLPGQK
jgi:hypothetical protein